MELMPLEEISSKTKEAYTDEPRYVKIGNGLAHIQSGKKMKRCYKHWYDPMIFLRKLNILMNAYLMVSYEHEGKWLDIQTCSLYETKVKTMFTTSGQHGGWCMTYLNEKETEIRQEWKKKMVHDGLDFNSAVAQTVQMDIWPTEKDIIYEGQRVQVSQKATINHPGLSADPKPSGEFSSGGPAPPKRPSVLMTPPGQFTFQGRPSYKSDDSRPWRWQNKRHEICMKWENGECKYPDADCNRAHGPLYLTPKVPSPSPKNKGKKGKGKQSKY